MAKTEVQSLTFPGWVTFAAGIRGTVRASLCEAGIQIEIPTPRRSTIRVVMTPERFVAFEPRQASHAEALIAVTGLLDHETIEKALALVLETCEDAAEAFDSDETRDRSDALRFLAALVRGVESA